VADVGADLSMRKGFVIVAALVLLLAAGFVFAVFRKNHERGAQLVADLAAFRSRRHPIARPDGAPPARVENAAACVAATLSVAPSDLSPFVDASAEAGKFIRAEKPLSELPETTLERMGALRPWVSAVRACADAQSVTFVDAFAPWDFGERGTRQLMVVARHAGIETRMQLEAGLPADALATCTSTMEVLLDASHFSLVHALIANAGVKLIAPACAAAWKAADQGVRAQFAPRWMLLGARYTNDHDVIEAERLTLSLLLYAPLCSDADRAKLPTPSTGLEAGLAERFLLSRIWPDWDAAMRQTADANDASAHAAAAQARQAAIERWWVPDSAGLKATAADYGRFAAKMHGTRAFLTLLASVASEGRTPLPPEAKQVGETLQITDSEGDVVQLVR
jgi:hypothetical protein